MNFVLKGHDLEHAAQTAVQLFFQNEGYKRLTQEYDRIREGQFVLSEINAGICRAAVYNEGAVISEKSEPMNESAGKKERTQAVARTIFLALSEMTGKKPPWGTLAGVRPAKIIWDLWAEGFDGGRITQRLTEIYLTTAEKAALCLEIAEAERKVLGRLNENGIGVYINVPFCATRCKYCSFTSYPLERFSCRTDDYFSSLFRELEYIAEATKGKPVDTVYAGGGTPTSVTPDALERLLIKINELFDIGTVKEFTVEAGRPDSTTPEKLKTLKRYGVTRISVNPQTMNGETLIKIGRNHTPDDFVRAFGLARDAGFDNINCDVILGLTGETPADALNTFERLKELSPESITAHTLAVKRAAELNRTDGRFSGGQSSTGQNLTDAGDIASMLDISRRAAIEMNLFPYYLYRQKNMLGNFENIGYARAGFESAYNIQTMTERRSVWAAGAGGVTKLVNNTSGLIERAFNIKDLDGYIAKIDEMIDRKKAIVRS